MLMLAIGIREPRSGRAWSTERLGKRGATMKLSCGLWSVDKIVLARPVCKLSRSASHLHSPAAYANSHSHSDFQITA